MESNKKIVLIIDAYISEEGSILTHPMFKGSLTIPHVSHAAGITLIDNIGKSAIQTILDDHSQEDPIGNIVGSLSIIKDSVKTIKETIKG